MIEGGGDAAMPGSRVFSLLLLAAAIMVPLFFLARAQARRSTRSRTFLVVKAVGFGLVGAYVAFVLPGSVPDTPGSPAALVMLLALWSFGGFMLLGAVPAFFGAIFAGRRAVEE
jgi:hypothetical protein